MQGPVKTPRLKVAIVITKMELGGAQQVALQTAIRLDPNQFETFLIAGQGGMLDPKAKQALGNRFIPCAILKHPIAPFWDLLTVFWLARFFIKEDIDIVHTHSSKAGLVGRIAAWLAGAPLIVHTVHGWSFNDFMDFLTRQLFVFLERWLAKITDILICVADSLEKKAMGLGIGQRNQYVVIRAAVDLKEWTSMRCNPLQVKSRLGLPYASVVVGSLANCKPQKNPEDFVRVASQVIARCPNAWFVYVGDGPLKARAEQLAGQLGILNQVRFIGWREDPREIVMMFDVFLLTSLWEGLPCVFPQAMALGLPIVATDVDGASEVVKDGVTGYLCKPHDVDGLADRVCCLLKNPSLQRRFGEQAKASLGPEWTFDDMVNRTAQAYLSICPVKKRRSGWLRKWSCAA